MGTKMVFKSKLCLMVSLLVPWVLVSYFFFNIGRLHSSLVPLKATIHTFETKGSHSNYRKIIKLEEYKVSFVRYYAGASMLFVKNLHHVIYEPPKPGQISEVYELHPTLKPIEQRQVSLLIQKEDALKIQQKGVQIPYFDLKTQFDQRSKIGYTVDLYLYLYRNNSGPLTLFISLLLFTGCCIGSSWWYEQHKLLRAYAIAVVVFHILVFVF